MAPAGRGTGLQGEGPLRTPRKENHTSASQTFLSASAGAALAFGSGFWRSVFADPAVAGTGPYGSLGTFDANGIRLPTGFRSRVIAGAGERVGDTGYVWHVAPDGAATFPAPDGGWHYVCNSETVGNGGVGAIRFAPDGS